MYTEKAVAAGRVVYYMTPHLKHTNEGFRYGQMY